MKKIALAAALAATTVAMADIKVGTVDMFVLVRNHASYEPNEKLLNDTEKDYAKKIDRLKAGLEETQEEYKKLTEQYRNPMLAQSAKDKLEKQIVDLQNKLLAGQQTIRNEITSTCLQTTAPTTLSLTLYYCCSRILPSFIFSEQTCIQTILIDS